MPSTTTRSVSRRFMLVLALGCLFPVVAYTQNFPARPVRLRGRQALRVASAPAAPSASCAVPT